MRAYELSDKLNALIKERGFDKGESNFWETIEIVNGLTEEILKEIPNAEFYARRGHNFYDDGKSKNNIYVYTNTHSYIDEDNNHLLCEIKVHRTKVKTRYYSRSYHYSLWAITGVTVIALKDVEFEEEYRIAKAELEQATKEREEREAKAQAEYEERQRQYDLEATEKAQKVLDYIKEHNLDVEEFEDMANKYCIYNDYFHKLLNK